MPDLPQVDQQFVRYVVAAIVVVGALWVVWRAGSMALQRILAAQGPPLRRTRRRKASISLLPAGRPRWGHPLRSITFRYDWPCSWWRRSGGAARCHRATSAAHHRSDRAGPGRRRDGTRHARNPLAAAAQHARLRPRAVHRYASAGQSRQGNSLVRCRRSIHSRRPGISRRNDPTRRVGEQSVTDHS